jgi:hypothetical protein
MTFFRVKNLKGSCNICQLLFCVFNFLDISSSFTMSPLHPLEGFKYKFFFLVP